MTDPTRVITTNRVKTFARIEEEVHRQDQMFPGQWDAGALPNGAKLAILMEEVGEVAREMYENGPQTTEHLRTELTHVAAVAAHWLESISFERPGEKGE